MVSTVEKYKALDHWLRSCVKPVQVDALVDIANTTLLMHDNAEHEFNLIKRDAEKKRLQIILDSNLIFHQKL